MCARLKGRARSGIRCLREHGWKYTFLRVLEKLIVGVWPPLSITILFILRILPGYYQYANLKRKTKGVHIYCQYYPGTGDVRYSSSYIRIIYERNLYPAREESAVLAVNGGSAAKVAELFCPREIPIIQLKSRGCLSLVHLLRFAESKSLDMTLLHYFDTTMYTSITFRVMSRKGASFETLYAIALLNEEKVEWPMPEWDNDEIWVDKIFKEEKLLPHKTVVISPFANSLAYGPDASFWESIVRELEGKGFSICTNISGRREKPIRGTVGVNIPYKYLKCFICRSGYFLAFRSGLCDLAALIPSNKVILYPDKLWPDAEIGNISTLAFFSLKQAGYRNTIEYVYRKNIEEYQLVTCIVHSLTDKNMLEKCSSGED